MKVFSETPEITVTIPDDLPTRRGHEFQGWSTEKNGAAQYHANDQITLYQDNPTLRLYAVWGK